MNKNLLASILFFFVGHVSIAQGSVPPPPMPPPPPGLPIDGNIIVLIVVALIYGICKVIQLRKLTA